MCSFILSLLILGNRLTERGVEDISGGEVSTGLRKIKRKKAQ